MTWDKVSDSVQQVTSHLWADLFSRELIIFCAYTCKEPSIWQRLKLSTLQLKCNYHLSPLPVTQYFLESLSICASRTHFLALGYTQQSFFASNLPHAYSCIWCQCCTETNALFQHPSPLFSSAFSAVCTIYLNMVPFSLCCYQTG